MDPQQKAFAEEVARLVSDNRPTVFTQSVMIALITALSTISLALIAQASATIGAYLKMRTLLSQNMKAQDEQKSAIKKAVEVQENLVKSQTAEIKEAIAQTANGDK